MRSSTGTRSGCTGSHQKTAQPAATPFTYSGVQLRTRMSADAAPVGSCWVHHAPIFAWIASPRRELTRESVKACGHVSQLGMQILKHRAPHATTVAIPVTKAE